MKKQTPTNVKSQPWGAKGLKRKEENKGLMLEGRLACFSHEMKSMKRQERIGLGNQSKKGETARKAGREGGTLGEHKTDQTGFAAIVQRGRGRKLDSNRDFGGQGKGGANQKRKEEKFLQINKKGKKGRGKEI